MPEDKMDSSIPQVTLKASTSDQPTGQGLSSVKKRGKENATPAGLAALIGGPQSFASLLMKKGHDEKEGALSPQVESAAGNNDVEKAHIGSLNDGSEFFFPQKAMGHAGMGAVALGRKTLSEANVQTSSGNPATEEVLETKTKGKSNAEMSGKTQIVKADGITGEDVATNLLKGDCVQEGEALSGGLVSGQGKRIFDGLRGLPVHEMEGQKIQHDTDLSKGSDVKGSSYSKISPDPKGREMQSMKDGNQYSAEVVKDNTTSIRQIQAESEKIENYKNLSTTSLKSERSLPSGADDIQTGKTGSSLSAAQTEFSIGSGVWNDVRTGVNDKIAAPVIFQEVAGQIIDGASNMLLKGSSRIVITLEPPNLGTLNMDVRVQHDMVRMVLIADNHEVKQVLHANLDQLKTALQGQGLNIDRFDVLVNERSHNGSQGFQPGGGTLFDGGQGKRDDTKNDSLPPHVLPSGGNEINEPSLGIISLFV
jgi:flagellar hook-length control protein FliK